MTKRNGSDFVLQIETSTGVWENIPVERVSGYTVANESVDTTAKAQTSRELSACGVKTVNITASGIVKDSISTTLFNFLCNAAFGNTIQYFRVMSGPYIVVSKGNFLVASFGRSGEYNGAEQWTLTLESADVITQEEAPPMPLPPLGTYDGAVAFSVRRLTLPSAYSGPCMRLRRSSDNAEQDIGFNSSHSSMIKLSPLCFCDAELLLVDTDGYICISSSRTKHHQTSNINVSIIVVVNQQSSSPPF
jgi:predicted secreted protein